LADRFGHRFLLAVVGQAGEHSFQARQPRLKFGAGSAVALATFCLRR
jgi:hypothetical protein